MTRVHSINLDHQWKSGNVGPIFVLQVLRFLSSRYQVHIKSFNPLGPLRELPPSEIENEQDRTQVFENESSGHESRHERIVACLSVSAWKFFFSIQVRTYH
jgi:hypothetical protein